MVVDRLREEDKRHDKLMTILMVVDMIMNHELGTGSRFIDDQQSTWW